MQLVQHNWHQAWTLPVMWSSGRYHSNPVKCLHTGEGHSNLQCDQKSLPVCCCVNCLTDSPSEAHCITREVMIKSWCLQHVTFRQTATASSPLSALIMSVSSFFLEWWMCKQPAADWELSSHFFTNFSSHEIILILKHYLILWVFYWVCTHLCLPLHLPLFLFPAFATWDTDSEEQERDRTEESRDTCLLSPSHWVDTHHVNKCTKCHMSGQTQR